MPAGGAIAAATAITNSTVNGNTATAAGSGTGVLVSNAPAAAARALAALAAPARAPRQAAPDSLRALATLTRGLVSGTVRRLVPARAQARAARTGPLATVLTSADSGGGGIGALSGPAGNITVSGNAAAASSTGLGVASTQGGGIGTANALTNATVAGNTGTATGPAGSGVTGGGAGTSASLANTIVAGNAPTDCGAATGADAGGNLDGDGTCGLSAASGSVSAGTANLGPLAGNGSLTQTRALLAGSQAIGLGVAATCEQLTGPNGTADTDERGSARNSSARQACDSGAYDTGGTAPA